MNHNNEEFPSAIEAVFLVLGLFAAEYIVRAALLDLRSFSGMDPRDIVGIVALLGNCVVFSVLLYYKRMTYASLFHPSSQSVTATITVLTMPVLLIVPGLLMAVSTIQAILVWMFPLSHWHQAMFEQMMSSGVASVITVCILAPVLEEMLFRGIILRSFLRRYRRSYAIVGSAALFGLAHLNVYQFAVGLVLGLISGWLYERARSLWPCIFLHAAYNSAVMWVYYSSQSTGQNIVWQPPVAFWIGAFILMFVGISLLQRLLVPSGKPN